MLVAMTEAKSVSGSLDIRRNEGSDIWSAARRRIKFALARRKRMISHCR
jgi:hypothetical protein